MDNNVKTNTMREQAKFWYDPALGNLELLRAKYITHSFSPHIHEGFAIGVIADGVEQFTCCGSVYAAPANSIVIINPGEVHTGHAGVETGWSYRMFYPDATMLQQVASEVAGHKKFLPYFPTPVIQDKQLAKYLNSLHFILENSVLQLERETNFLWTMSQLVARHSTPKSQLRTIGREHQAVKRVQEYLDVHYAEHILLDRLAKVADLSSFHLIRVFRRQVGLPPHAYLKQVRIKQAKILLRKSEPIAQVAFATGFVDQSHLTKQFKRIVGVTPKQYINWRK